MTDERTFINVDNTVLIHHINAAQRKIVFVAPGVQKPVADALAKRLTNSPQMDITVILDIDPEVCRLGYGHIDGLTTLKTACEKRDMLLLHQPGIRIGLFIADDFTIVYSPTPLLIEAGAKQPDKPNAIRLETAAIPKVEMACTATNDDQSPEIGLDPAKTPDIQSVKKDLEVNPPQQFDVSRAVRIFNSRIQYVEFQFTGYKISQKQVSIPASLIGLADNRELVERWNNSFRVFGEAADFKWKRTVRDKDGVEQTETVTEKSLDTDKKKIVTDFLLVLPRFGSVILRNHRADFDERIKEFAEKVEGFRIAVEKHLNQEMQKSRGNLAYELAKRLMVNLPTHIKKTLPDNPNLATVTERVEDELTRIFGKIEDVFVPKVELRFKEVSYETLSDPGFIAALKKTFKKTFTQLFSEYDAALATGIMQNPHVKDSAHAP